MFKPHNAAVVDISFSESSPLFASTGGDGTVFFFDIRSKLSSNYQWIPLKFVRLLTVSDVQNKSMPHTIGHSALVCETVTWRQHDGRDLAVCSCSDGVLREYDVSSLVKSEMELKQPEELPTFEAILPMTERIVKVPMTFSCPIIPVVVGAVAKTNSTLSATVNIVSSKDLLQSGTAPVDIEDTVPQYVSVRVSNSLCLPSLTGNMVAGAAWGNKFVLLHSSTEDDTYASEFATGTSYFFSSF